MNTDSLFGSLVSSAMRLSSGLLVTLGLVLMLLMTNIWAIALLLGSQQEKAVSHFARVMENIREQEVFLQAIADRLVAPTDSLQGAPPVLKQVRRSGDGVNELYEVAESDFSMPFTVALAQQHQNERSLNALSALGWHLTNYYSRFWALSQFPSPQLFVFSPQNPSSIAVPAVGRFRSINLLEQQNYTSVAAGLMARTLSDPDKLLDYRVHWAPIVSGLRDTGGRREIVAYVAGELPINPVRVDSSMDRVVVTALLELGHSGDAVGDLELPFHGQFTLIDPQGNVLTGQREPGGARAGFSLTTSGLLISTFESDSAQPRWQAQYFVDYPGLFRWLALPVLRLLAASLVLILGLRWLYRRYQARVVAPAKEAQARLLESQAFSHAVIEGAPAGLVVIGKADGRMVIENLRAQQGRPVSQAVVELLRTTDAVLDGDACMVLEGRYYLVNYSSARYQEQEVQLCAFSDITEHQQRSLALHQAKQEAERANEAKTVFLTTMSHEIRTPLYGVLGTLELLGLSRLDKRQRDYLQTIQSSSSTVLQVISDVLDVSKIESGQLALETTAFSPLEVVEQVIAAHVVSARGKGLQVYACTDPWIPDQLLGDMAKLRQVLHNLVGNAIKFTSIGRVVLRCQVLESTDAQVSLRFQVADTGIGINEQQQLHIFEPFYQASTSNLVSGTGLGLSICQRFVERMGGHITVVSEQGLGSSFTVQLPFERTAATVESAPAIDLGGHQVQVRAPACELAEHLCAWLVRWGARATVVSASPHGALSEALLVDVLADPEQTFAWPGRRLLCEHDGPRVPEYTGECFRVSAHHLRAIAEGVRMATEEVPAGADPLPGATPASLGFHVLVAEDNLVNQAILKEQLEALGCRVSVAGDGRQALQVWQQGGIEVVLSDVNMPVMNGYELARAIRADSRQVPIIGITANALRDEGERCIAAGMSAWMVKPLLLEDLLDVLGGLPSGGVVQDPGAGAGVTAGVLSDSMRSLFCRTMRVDIDALHAALATGDQAEVVQLVHSVSGALAVVRADELSQVFGDLEQRLHEQALDAALQADLNRALDRLFGLVMSI